MKFPDLEYIAWAKSLPAVRINLARSGIDHCPVSLLGLKASDLVATLPVKYGYAPLRDAIARRYRVAAEQVFELSGGTSFANWIACAAVLDGCGRGTEVLVERPTYEPLLRVPQALGYRIRRFDRRFDDQYAIDLDRFESLISAKTRLAVVTNLHNPSGARIDLETMRTMAGMLARVGGYLLVDEVYLECLFRQRPESSIQAGTNVLVTNSLTKAYGLDGLRAGWILGSKHLVERAGRINDLMTNNPVAPGERMALAAFRRQRVIDARAHRILDPNLERVRRFIEGEPRLRALIPEGGNVAFPKLPSGVDSDRLASRLVDRYSTLVVPGRFFEAPRHIRISFGCRPSLLARGLENISRALDDLS
jgi:aspartate/methionine/tyrosine aminotransferase